MPVSLLKNGLPPMINVHGYLAVKNRYSYYTRFCELIRDADGTLKWKVFLHYGKTQQCTPLNPDPKAAIQVIREFCLDEGAYFLGEISAHTEKFMDVFGDYYLLPFQEEDLQ